jgi:hypothetical protein
MPKGPHYAGEGKIPLEVLEHMFYNLDAGLEGEASGRHPSVERSEGTTGFSRWGNRVKFQL